MRSGIVRVLPAGFAWTVQSSRLRTPLYFATLEAAIEASWQHARKEHAGLEIRRQNGTIRLRSAAFEDIATATPGAAAPLHPDQPVA